MKLPTMNARQFSTLLESLNACEEAREWAKGKSLAGALRACKRADWMLWLLGMESDKLGWLTRPQVVLLACTCAERTLKHVPKGEDRPRLAIEAARRWAHDPTDANREAAARASAASAWASAAAWAAARAAASAAWASAWAARAAWAAEHHAMCDIIRKEIKAMKA